MRENKKIKTQANGNWAVGMWSSPFRESICGERTNSAVILLQNRLKDFMLKNKYPGNLLN